MFVAPPSDFNQGVGVIERRITLRADNTFTVRLEGAPGSGLTIEIFGFDREPPTISATVSPAPNAAGWNNTDVTVSFSATDALSGIANVSAPVTVTTEGGNQTITGTATDRAGNSATADAKLNIDKTLPVINITSVADGARLTTADVTVAGTISDSLSGVAGVSCNGIPASVSGSTFNCAL